MIAQEPNCLTSTKQNIHNHTSWPCLVDGLGLCLVAVTTFILAYSWLVPVIPTLIFLAIWTPFLIVYRQNFLFELTKETILPLIFIGYILFSFFWSDIKTHTLFYGLEYLATFLIMLIITRIISIRALVLGLSIGCFAVLVFRYAAFFINFVAWSKNQVGFFAELATFSSIMSLFVHNTRKTQKLIFGILPLLLGFVVLIFSKSASSVLSLVVVLAFCFLITLIGKLPKEGRTIIVTLSLIITLSLSLSVVALGADPESGVLALFGKESTLTGRTDLWEAGIRTTLENNPIVGFGYSAFWLPDRYEANVLLDEFGMKNYFHFHSMFIQVFVELGGVGLTLLVFMLLKSLFSGFSRFIQTGTTVESIFFIGIALMFLVRSFVEVDYYGPFNICTILFYMTQIWPAPASPRTAQTPQTNMSEKTIDA